MIRTSLLNATEVRAVVVTAEAVNAVTINASSITTGTLSANRISTGSLNADKITAGTITATQINATSIAAATVTADNINSISLTSTQGSIGGWDINTTAIKKGTYASSGTPTLAINSVNSGSGSFYNGGQKLAGYGMYWYRSSNAGHIVLGQVASNGSTIKTGYYGIQMMDWTGLEHFCLSAGTATSGSRPVYNRIGGWSFDSNSIYSGTSKDISGYATSGLTLYSGGSLHAKQFYIDTSGNAFFKGNITGASGTFSGKLSANSGSIGGLTISGNTLYAGSTSSNRYIKLEAKADGTGYIDIRGTSSSTNLLYIQGGRMQHQAGIFYAADTYLRGDTQAWTGIDFTYGAVRTSTNVGTRIEATGIQGAGVKNPTWSTSSGSPTLLSVTATSGSTKFGNVYFLDESSGSKKYVRLPYTSGVLDGTTIRIGSRGRDINIVANSSSQLGWNDSSPTSSGTYSLTEENRWTLWIKFGNAWWLAHNQNL